MPANLMVVKDGTLKLGPTATAVSVECQISKGVITPAPDPKEFRGMCGRTIVPGITAYTLDLDYAQDWGDTGISTFLHENDGTLVDFELIPTSATEPKATGKVWVSPGAFGGDSGEIATASVSLGIDGKPTITSVTPAP